MSSKKKESPIKAKPIMVIQGRKFKSIILDAVQLNVNNILEVKRWAVGSRIRGYDGSPTERHLVLEGGQIARQGDFIVKHVDGRFYAFKQDTFEAITELISFTPKYDA